MIHPVLSLSSFKYFCRNVGDFLYDAATNKVFHENVSKEFQENISPVVEKVKEFSGSIIGTQVIAGVTAVAAETAGMTIGGAFPEATMAFAAGKEFASQALEKSKPQATGREKALVTWSAGVGAALTATALVVGLSYLTGGSGMESGAVRWMVQSAGTIVGGMQGLKMSGIGVPASKNSLDSYPVRTAQYLAARAAVGMVRNIIPVPQSLTLFTGVVGGVFESLSGTAGYHAQPLARLAIQAYNGKPPKTNFYDPGNFIIGVMNVARGNTVVGTKDIVGQLDLPYFLQTIIGKYLQVQIDNKTATNVAVRCLNQYMTLIQNPAIQKAMADYMTADKAKKEQLQKALLKTIQHVIFYNKVFRSSTNLFTLTVALGMENLFLKQITEAVDSIVAQVQEAEQELIGFNIADLDKGLLGVHLMGCILMASTRIQRTVIPNEPDLKDEEVRLFYTNMNKLFFTPFNGYAIGRGLQQIVGAGIPLLLNYPGIPLAIAKQIGGTLVEESDEMKIEELKDDMLGQGTKPTNNVQPKAKERFSFFSFLKGIGARIEEGWSRFIKSLFKPKAS